MSQPADEEEIEVVYVKAHARKLRFIYPPVDDLRCCWPSAYRGPPGPDWPVSYYMSQKELTHPTGVVVPENTPFALTELTEGKLFVNQAPTEEHPFNFGGDYLSMTCLDPRDPERTLTFGFWHGAQEAQQKNFSEVTNAMEVLAIAGTGLLEPSS